MEWTVEQQVEMSIDILALQDGNTIEQLHPEMSESERRDYLIVLTMFAAQIPPHLLQRGD